MEVQEMRQVFIDSAVRVVARDGLEKTTTKAIASEAKLNEAYRHIFISVSPAKMTCSARHFTWKM